MLEEIIHKGVKNNICFYNENRTILESEVENIVKYDTYFKPNFLKINELPLKPDEEYLTYDHYQLLYDIPEEDLFYIRLKGMCNYTFLKKDFIGSVITRVLPRNIILLKCKSSLT